MTARRRHGSEGGRAGAREILQIQEQIIVIIFYRVRGGEDRGNGAWVIVQKHINKEEKRGGGGIYNKNRYICS